MTSNNLSAVAARLIAIPIEKSVLTLRRKLHRYPELSNREFRTTLTLKKKLEKLGLTISCGKTPTGLWADLDSGRPGPTVAVRTDIDALAVDEQTGLPCASRHPGVMHACGHDVHMAVLIGTAKLLTRLRNDLVGRVRFICQPAEEQPPGGARSLVEAGVLKNPAVDVILGLHVDPALPVGTIGLRDGVNFVAVHDFDIRVIGRAAHAALPHMAVDALAVASEIISGLQQVVSRQTDPLRPVVITLGTICGGQARNVIPGEVVIEGTARSLDPAITRRLPGLIKKNAVGIGRGLGARVEVVSRGAYPPLRCDSTVNARIAESFHRLYPKHRVMEPPLVMGSEDFACYLEQVPGSMFRLGIANKAQGADKPWHHPAFKVDERAIKIGYTVMALTVIDLLHHPLGKRR
ncbi:MAG: amidohydrolase [candidate division Zixibacteria bacterium]|nr:amidohydrolase [candidate division Zixibacteria bacterium]